MKPLAKKGLQAVSSGKVKFVSEKFTKIYRHWLNNIKDWNISRQIAWGIRIPVWYCGNKSQISNSKQNKSCPPIVTDGTKPTKCPNCGSTNLVQDPDVFDTWFSSGQWPFAALQTTKKGDFTKFYPTSVMETGWDIIFFWVARMIMLGIYVTGKVPFKTVYLHGLVRDKDRQKMSKSKGNVIDPLAVAAEYGSDAVRMALIFGTGAGDKDIIITEEKIRAMRNFTTKIWNASRFIRMQNAECRIRNAELEKNSKLNSSFIIHHSSFKIKTDADKIILSKLRQTIKTTTKHIDDYRFGQAADEVYNFFWHDFCDKYLEESKKQMQDQNLKSNTQKILLHTLISSIKLIHPFMPFVTEKIYQILRQNGFQLKAKSIMISNWPNPS